MQEIEVVQLHKPRKPRKAPVRRKIARSATKPLSEYRKGLSARKVAKKVFWRKYGTNAALMRADAIFSAKVRNRDKVCQFTRCEVSEFSSLQCSHYIGRGNFATRFDEENCIALCWRHHFKDKMLGWEYQKQREEVQGWDGQYTKFMRRWLGEEKFNALIERSKESVKRTAMVQKVLDDHEAVEKLGIDP